MSFGDNFYSNCNALYSVHEKIVFGDNCLLGWNVSCRDSDNHTVIYDGNPKLEDAAGITIGSHVWLCACVDIQKGVNIPNDCVVAFRSLVTKPFYEDGILIGGHPAKKIKSNINWKK